MKPFAYNIRDIVKIAGYSKEYVIQTRKFGDAHNWYTFEGNSIPYREDQLVYVGKLKEVAKMPDTIQTLYRVDGMEFETLEEAQHHDKKVKLFDLLSKNMSDEDKDALIFFVDALIDNAAALKGIL